MAPTPQDDPSTIQGLPAGAVLKPISPTPVADDPSQVQGLPAGAVLKPMGSAGADTSTASTQTQPAPDYLTKTEDFIHNTAQGVGEGIVKDVWPAVKNMVPGGPAETAALRTVWNNLPPVQLAQQTEQILPVIDAYEKARSGGASITDAIKASDVVARQHARNIDVVGNAVKAFQANPTREGARAVTDAAAAIAASFGGDAALGAIAPEAESAETAMATKTATPAPSWATRINPFRKVTLGGEQMAPRPLAGATANAPAATQAVKNIAGAASTDAGGLPISHATSLRDMWQEPVASLEAKAKPYYAALDAASNGEWTSIDNGLKNVEREIRMKGGAISDAAEQELQAKKIRLQMQQEQILDKLPPDTAQKAKAAWYDKSRLEDLGDAFTRGVVGQRPETVAPGAGIPGAAEKFDFKKVAKALNGMDPDDITRALGGDRAKMQQLVTAVNAGAKEGLLTMQHARKLLLPVFEGTVLGRLIF